MSSVYVSDADYHNATVMAVPSTAPKDLDSGLESLLEVFPQFRGEAPSCSEGAVNALHVILLSNPLEEEVRLLYGVEG